MGWASGTELMCDVISAVQDCVPVGSRKVLYGRLIDAFEKADWDTQDECLGQDPEFDAALKERYPDSDE